MSKDLVNVEPCLSDLELLYIARISYDAARAFDKLSMTEWNHPNWDELPNGDKSAMALCIMNVHRRLVNPDNSTENTDGVNFYNDSNVKFGDIQQRIFVGTAVIFVNEFRRKRSQYVFGNNGYHASFKELI